MKKITYWLKAVREIFLPLLEPIPDEKKKEQCKRLKESGNHDKVFKKVKNLNKTKTKECINLLNNILKKEEERNNTIERKATTLISVDGLIIALIINFVRILVQIAGLPRFIIVILFVFTIFYFGRTLIFALKCLARKSYQQIDISYIIKQTKLNDTRFLQKILSLQIAVYENNSPIINEKVNYMVMSHEYFKRAVTSVILLGISYVLITIFN